MRHELTVSIDGKPITQNDRVANVTKDGRPYIHYRNNKELNLWRAEIATAINDAVALDLSDRYPLTTPCAVEAVFYMKRPQSHFLKSGTLRPDSPEYHSGRPDVDNLVKSVLDAVGKSGVWCDDCQVVLLRAEKRYTTETRGQGVDITLWSKA